MRAFIWKEPSPREYFPELLHLAGGNPVVAAALAARGYSTSERAVSFLDPSHYVLSQPTDLPDLDRAVERIIMAIRKKERLAVWGDFDVDGQTSTTILVSGLCTLGADVIFHIPVRAKESHGVNLPGLQDLIHQGANLILTCDTGVGDHEAADFCRASGIDYIITDHHSLPDRLPEAFAVVNPRRLPDGHPAQSLSGVGCAWFLLKEIADRLGRPEAALAQLDLAALGLVADLVELTGDCRCLVQQGLKQIRQGQRLALTAIAAAAGLDLQHTTEEHISFVIAPRLNALGRLGDANEIVDFFTTTDPVKAGVFAARLDGLNLRRKLLTDQVFAAAANQVETGRLDRDHAVLVLHHPLWPAGILGIAASRLVEAYHLPVILLSSPEGELARGSARSVEGIDITAAIAASAPLLAGFGGHPMAGGLSLPVENIPQFWKEIERAILSGQAGRPLPLVLQIDANLALPEINLDLVNQIEILAPFGPGNAPLLFSSRGLIVSSRKILGRPGDHLQMTLKDEAGHSQKVLWWNGAGKPLPQGKFELAYHLRSTSYLGEPQLQVEWVAWRQLEAESVHEIPPTKKQEWLDYRASSDPVSDLKKIAAFESPQVWQEGTGLSPLKGVDRYQIAPAKELVIWTAPAGWDDLRQVLESAIPEKIFLFSLPAEPSKPADLLKRLLGLIQYAVQTYDGWISIEKMAALAALPEPVVQLGVNLFLSRTLFHLTAREGGRMQFTKGCGGTSTENQDMEDDFIRLVAEVNAFRSLFERMSLDEIKAKIQAG
ncbi:MAG: single-stranded-DNA-specific exonuclease RecJ [Anaerolineaceae bacterium]